MQDQGPLRVLTLIKYSFGTRIMFLCSVSLFYVVRTQMRPEDKNTLKVAMGFGALFTILLFISIKIFKVFRSQAIIRHSPSAETYLANK